MTVLVIAMLSAWDCASRSWAGIMWKLLFVLSCIITRIFWTVCPSCWALWSAKALSFPPDHEAMSFKLFLSPFLWEVGVLVWMVYPALDIRVVVKGYARKG